MTTHFGNLELDKFETEGWRVIVATGELTVYEAPKLREWLVASAKEGFNRIVVDLQEVDFVDSTGLAVMVAAYKRVRLLEGDLRVVCSNYRILKVLEITGLNKVINIFDTVEAATALGS